MSQTSLHDYYTVIKKRPDELGKSTSDLNIIDLKDEIKIKNQLIKTDKESFKVPITPVQTKLKSIKLREIKSESLHLNKKANKSITSNLDSNNQESILKWTKRTINANESSSEKKKKRIEEANSKPIDDESIKKTSVRKRLFDIDPKLNELRDKIKNVDESFLSKLKDFKAKTASPIKLQLNNLNSPTKRLKEREERRAKAKEFLNLSPKKFLEDKLSNSPVKSATKPRIVDGLNLPSKYKILIDNFHCLDSVVSMLFNRLETCTFDKIKQGIQKITKKNFDLTHIAQILTIYPKSFSLCYAKKTAVDNLNNLNVLTKQSFYLVLTPKLTNSTKMTPTVLKSRRDEFEISLNRFARKLHNDYLLSLDPPVAISDDELRRWHPSFIFPSIPESKLPEPPASLNESKSINEFWASKLNIQQTVKKQEEPIVNDQKKNKIKKGILKGLSQDFLDKVCHFI